MTKPTLQDRYILIAEDEYLIADQIQFEFVQAGATVLGPAATVRDALELVDAAPHVDGAVLDVGLRGEKVFPLADVLTERGVPFVFLTGYDESVIPKRFQQVLRCEKPITTGITHTILHLLLSHAPAQHNS